MFQSQRDMVTSVYLRDTAGLRTVCRVRKQNDSYSLQGVFPQQNEQGRIRVRATVSISFGIVDILSRPVIFLTIVVLEIFPILLQQLLD